jgi:fatty acid-binding protein DegV
MQIVVDRGMDIHENQLDGMLVHYAPLRITLGEKSYVSGVDIQFTSCWQRRVSSRPHHNLLLASLPNYTEN